MLRSYFRAAPVWCCSSTFPLRITDPVSEKRHYRIFLSGFIGKMQRMSAVQAGLGLSIVKSIMHALGGSVSAESGEGKGTVIVLQLPYAHGNH